MCHVVLSGTLCVLTYLILKEPYGVSAIIISFYSWQRSAEKKTVWGYTVGKEWSQDWSQAICSGPCSQLSGDRQELETVRSLQMTTLTFSLRLFPGLCNGDTHFTNLAKWMRGSINIYAQSYLSSIHTEGIWTSFSHLWLDVSCMDSMHRYLLITASLVDQTIKNLPALQETRVQPLGREDPLEKGMVIHSSILAWKIPRTEEPGGLSATVHGVAESDRPDRPTLTPHNEVRVQWGLQRWQDKAPVLKVTTLQETGSCCGTQPACWKQHAFTGHTLASQPGCSVLRQDMHWTGIKGVYVQVTSHTERVTALKAWGAWDWWPAKFNTGNF